MKFVQQGDVLFTRVNQVPSGAEDVKTLVLAEGEATGHAHRAGAGAKLRRHNNRLYLEVAEDGTPVTHEEHKPILFPQGVWEVSRVLEYDHFAEEAREVRD